MPITLKQGMMAYKGGDGEYHGINVVGETTTAEQVAAVQSAGASAVASVQAAGQAARESIPSEYTELTEEVGDLKSAINVVGTAVNLFDKSTITEGRYFNSAGTVKTGDGSSISAQIVVHPGTKIYLSHHLNSTTRYNIFKDASGNTVSGEIYPCNADNMVLTVPAGAAYFRCTVGNSVLNEFKVTEQFALKELQEKVDSLDETIEEHNGLLEEYLLLDNLAKGVNYSSNYYVDYRDGSNTAGNTYRASEMIDITGCEKIVYNRLYSTGSTSYAGLAFYASDSLSSFIENSGVPLVFNQPESKYVLETVNVPAGAKYVRLTILKTDTLYEVYDYDDYSALLPLRVEKLEEQANDAKELFDDTFCTLAMFEKIGIIGDSYAMGSLYIPNGSSASYVGTYNNLSWGKNIQRLYGNNVTFFAHGGLSTKTWLTNTDCGIAALEAAAQTSPCNLYWFGLGINDVSLYNANNSYLGSLTDISGHTSGTVWAETFYGNVGQIITRVQAASPYSKIVIASFVGYRPRRQTAGDIALNNALEEIAEYFSLPFINLKDDRFYMSDFYSNNILGKHPIAMVYSGMAMANTRLFGKAVLNYQMYFKDYHMGTPAPDTEPDEPT